MQQIRMKSLHHNRNLMKQKRRCSNISHRLHQSLFQLAQQLKSIHVYWCKFQFTFAWVSWMFPAFCFDCYRLSIGRSSPARVTAFPGCPWRRSGSPSGDLSAPPTLSLRGWGPVALNRPPSAGRRREVSFPSLVTPVADEGGFTSVSENITAT